MSRTTTITRGNTIFDELLTAPYSKIKSLVNKHPNLMIDLDNYGNSLLHVATRINDHKVVEFLLKKGAEMNNMNKFGETPWTICIGNRDIEMIDIYLHYITELKLLEQKNNSNRKIKELKEQILELLQSHDKLRNKYNTLLVSNKRLRQENNDLYEKNNKLKISVNSLLNANSK